MNREALALCRVGLTFKFDKNSTDSKCFIFQFGGLGALFGGQAHQNPSPVATRLDHCFTLRRKRSVYIDLVCDDSLKKSRYFRKSDKFLDFISTLV